MTFTELAVKGAWLIDADVIKDERGAFVRAWVPEEFKARGLDTAIAQCSITSNHRRGTLRGLHFQAPPFEEVKVIRVLQGAIFDVAVDLRPDSETFHHWMGIELTSESRQSLYLPQGVAHGYQTLTDNAEIMYSVSAPYSPDHHRGLRWDDPFFQIEWPLGWPSSINIRDSTYPDYDPGF